MMRETSHARALFEQFIEDNQIYEGQISSSPGHFRKDLMIPILTKIRNLERERDE